MISIAFFLIAALAAVFSASSWIVDREIRNLEDRIAELEESASGGR